MRVLVDTSVWSLALRKNEKSENERKLIERLSELIRELHVVMIGPIRQEILSGISDTKRFDDLQKKMSIFPDLSLETEDYELAAKLYNECRKNGIQGSHIDFLICAVAINNNFKILTLDKDFTNYQKFIDIHLESLCFE